MRIEFDRPSSSVICFNSAASAAARAGSISASRRIAAVTVPTARIFGINLVPRRFHCSGGRVPDKRIRAEELEGESRYTIYRLPYEPVVTGEGALRPMIQIETAVWPLRRPLIELPVISFVAEALQQPPEVASIPCVSVVETAADRLVGFTRRAGAELAGLNVPDSTLVRHLHDLHTPREHCDPAEVVALAREIMIADAEAYGNQFPAYRENPLAETLRAVEGLAAAPGYARQYEEFQRLMVYGSKADYAACVKVIRDLAERLSAL
jgi:hypothetical protein